MTVVVRVCQARTHGNEIQKYCCRSFPDPCLQNTGQLSSTFLSDTRIGVAVSKRSSHASNMVLTCRQNPSACSLRRFSCHPGKTSILCHLADVARVNKGVARYVKTMPTIATQMVEFRRKNVRWTVWDMSGQGANIRVDANVYPHGDVVSDVPHHVFKNGRTRASCGVSDSL